MWTWFSDSAASGETEQTEDLVVDYLDGDNAGVVVFGLNRPKVSRLGTPSIIWIFVNGIFHGPANMYAVRTSGDKYVSSLPPSSVRLSLTFLFFGNTSGRELINFSPDVLTAWITANPFGYARKHVGTFYLYYNCTSEPWILWTRQKRYEVLVNMKNPLFT